MGVGDRHIAIYLRISKRDQTRQEDGSIERQKNMILHWLQDQSFLQEKENILQKSYLTDNIRNSIRKDTIIEYKDEGYSGMTEHRPAYEKLLAAVLMGRVKLLVVKDFSRLSREYLVLARLREQVLPECQVRFVSLGDGYDSDAYQSTGFCGGLDISFRELFYEYYCHDISRKVKGALRAKNERGDYVSAKVPYGYRKENGRWKVQPEEAKILRFLFEQIAAGMTYKNAGRIVGMEPARVWYLVHNPVYTGCHVWHRYENHIDQIRRTRVVPKEQQCVQKNGHEPIVSEELFDAVAGRKHQTTSKKRHIFRGITKCGHCKCALVRRRRHPEMLCCRHCGEGESERISIVTLLQICGEQLCQEYNEDPKFGDWVRTILGGATDAEVLPNCSANDAVMWEKDELRRLLLQEMIDKIEVWQDKKVCIYWNFCYNKQE